MNRRTRMAVLLGLLIASTASCAPTESQETNGGRTVENSTTITETTTPETVTLPDFYITGIAAEIDPATGDTACMAKIGQLWQQFYTEAVAKIPNQVAPQKVLGVYSNYVSNHRGKYRLSPACEVQGSKDVPEGMHHMHVPPQRYLRFSAAGEQPAAVINTWSEIWKYFADRSHEKRAYTVDFEHYVSDKLVEIFIAVD